MEILLVGESWFTYSVHQKGFDSFQTAEYVEGAEEFIARLGDSGHRVDHIPAHLVPTRMPTRVEELQRYSAVVLSDVGSNTFLLDPATFKSSRIGVNRLDVLREYIAAGGGMLMVGGYMSFSGIDGRARYSASPLADVLPVHMLDVDDRVEVPQGAVPSLVNVDHGALASVGSGWPPLLGYNRVTAKASAEVLATVGGDPLLVVGTYGHGRAAAFTSDLAPHWAPPQFVAWPGYGVLWASLLSWLSGQDSDASADVGSPDLLRGG